MTIDDIPALVRSLPTSSLIRFIANGRNAGEWLCGHGLLTPPNEPLTVDKEERDERVITATLAALEDEINRRVPTPVPCMGGGAPAVAYRTGLVHRKDCCPSCTPEAWRQSNLAKVGL